MRQFIESAAVARSTLRQLLESAAAAMSGRATAQDNSQATDVPNKKTDLVNVGLREGDEKITYCWMSSNWTIAHVLEERTPEALKKENPVVVDDDGREVMHDVVLGDIPLSLHGLLHLTIQKSVWQMGTPCGIGECPHIGFKETSGKHKTLIEVVFHEDGKHKRVLMSMNAIPANIMTVVLHQKGGSTKRVLMPKTTSIADVLDKFTPIDLKNANPIVVVVNECGEAIRSELSVEVLTTWPDLTVSALSSDGKCLQLMFQERVEGDQEPR